LVHGHAQDNADDVRRRPARGGGNDHAHWFGGNGVGDDRGVRIGLVVAAVKRSNAPIFWLLFGAGGMVAALLGTILVFITGIAAPLGWPLGPDLLSYPRVLALAQTVLGKAFIFVVIALMAWHAVHRIFHFLHDLSLPTGTLSKLACYGSAMAVVYVPGAPTLTPTATMTSVATATSTPTSTPTATNTPTINLKSQLKANGSDNNQMSEFSVRVQNLGTTAASNVSVRIYFTLDNGRPVTDYRLVRQSGDAASISGPTLVSGTTYYFTVGGPASLAASGTWSVNLRLDLTTGPNNFSSGNDWWHNGTGALPGVFSDWLRVPAYANGSRVWGNEPP